jgi:DNA-binding response OmpR family regulator
MGFKKILVVDDEEMIRELAKDYLESKGYDVIIAEDGKKGLAEAKSKRPDLIILDVNMPKMNGFQVLDELKKDRHTMVIPVFMLTSQKSDEDIRQGMEHMADKYLPKPFMPEVLLEEIRKTLAVRGLS